MYGYVYKTTNLINDKVYIGQHKHSNWDNQYIGSGKILEIAIKKYGKENFCCELVEECSTQEELNDREIYWIAFYRKTNRCYNIANGGGGRSCNLSEETREKLSIANKGKKLSAETKMKMAKSRMGTSLSEETKMKISKIHKGKQLSKEHRKKLSQSHKGVPHAHSKEWRNKVSMSAKGKVVSEETKIKMSLAKSGKNHPNYGKHLSEETRKKISESKRKKQLKDHHKVGAMLKR